MDIVLIEVEKTLVMYTLYKHIHISQLKDDNMVSQHQNIHQSNSC